MCGCYILLVTEGTLDEMILFVCGVDDNSIIIYSILYDITLPFWKIIWKSESISQLI